MARQHGVTRSSRATWLRRGLFGVGALLVLAAGWFAITALQAKSELTKVKSELSQVRADVKAGDVAAARVSAADVAKHAHAAHMATNGPLWSALAAIPYVGDPVDTAHGMTVAADELGSTVVPELIDVAGQVDPSKLRQPGDQFNLSAITGAAPTIEKMAAQAQAIAVSVNQLAGDSWLGPINSARDSLASALKSLDGTLGGLDKIARVAPTMLGQNGTQRYFVTLMNEADSRGVGGSPDAYAILEADHGVVKFVHFGASSDFDGVQVDTNLGSDFTQRYRLEDPSGHYSWSNVSPNFPYAGQIWADMWKKKTGETIDGAISLDPTALSYLVGVTGKVRAADGTRITAKNVLTSTQSDMYTLFPSAAQRAARTKHQVDIWQAVDVAIITSKDTKGLLRQFGVAEGERRLLFWSADPTIESVLATTVGGGVLPQTTAPFVAPVITSRTNSELDFYLEPTTTVARASCGGANEVTVTMTLKSLAPGAGLSPDVTVRTDKPTYPTHPGDQRVNANYFATDGATLVTATLDGKPVTVVQGVERGHPTFQADVEIPHGQTRTVVLTLKEPKTAGAPIVLTQPTVRPLQLSVTGGTCSN